MKTIKQISTIVILISIAISSYSQGYHKRIAFIGNSITAGVNLSTVNLEQTRFSGVFDAMLKKQFGDTCIVANYAVSGRTMLKHGDFPIWKDPEFTACWQFAPDIFIIMLGTNDSKPYNWEPYKKEYFGDYISMIDTFKKRNPQVKIIVSLPPPAFKIVFDIRDSVIENYIIPLIDSVAKVTGSAIVDYNTPLKDSVAYFPDYIHPNEVGHKAMARILYSKFLQTDYIHKVDTGRTFVTQITSSAAISRDIDTITLSWKTVNADSAFLNGKIVPTTGSLKVNAKHKTIYTIKAKGKLNIDSLRLTQDFYHPLLTKLFISPGSVPKKVGDTIYYSMRFQDQNLKYITDTTYTVNWSVSGPGTLIKMTNTSATCITSGVGSVQVIAQIDSVKSNTSTITVTAKVDVANKELLNNDVNIFPNPSNGLIYISLKTVVPTSAKIKIIDLKGAVKIEQNEYISTIGSQTLKVFANNLTSGIYLFDIEYSGNHFVKKINIIHK